MSYINRDIKVGRLVADPELKQTTTGKDVCNFVLAVDDKFKDKDGNKITYFFDFVAWNGTAKFISQYCKKGELVCCDGRAVQEKFTDKDGNKRSSVRFVVDDVQKLTWNYSNSKPQEDEEPAQDVVPW